MHISLNNQYKPALMTGYIYIITISTVCIELMILLFFALPAKFVFDFSSTDKVAIGKILLRTSILIVYPLHVGKVKIFNAFRKALIKMRWAYIRYPNKLVVCDDVFSKRIIVALCMLHSSRIILLFWRLTLRLTLERMSLIFKVSFGIVRVNIKSKFKNYSMCPFISLALIFNIQLFFQQEALIIFYIRKIISIIIDSSMNYL